MFLNAFGSAIYITLSCYPESEVHEWQKSLRLSAWAIFKRRIQNISLIIPLYMFVISVLKCNHPLKPLVMRTLGPPKLKPNLLDVRCGDVKDIAGTFLGP